MISLEASRGGGLHWLKSLFPGSEDLYFDYLQKMCMCSGFKDCRHTTTDEHPCKTQNPCKIIKLQCRVPLILRLGSRGRRIPRAYWLASLGQSVSPGSVKGLVSKIEIDSGRCPVMTSSPYIQEHNHISSHRPAASPSIQYVSLGFLKYLTRRQGFLVIVPTPFGFPWW